MADFIPLLNDLFFFFMGYNTPRILRAVGRWCDNYIDDIDPFDDKVKKVWGKDESI